MVCASIERPRPRKAAHRKECESVEVDVVRRARETVAQHYHFRGRVDCFQFVLEREDVLTVRGRVPSFYLKQMLQTLLKDLDGVRTVNNRVEVVSCDGLSSVPGQ